MKSSVSESPEKKTAPLSHIAFIMDGNGRWAKKERECPREAGHRVRAEAFRKIMQHCCELDIKASTFYAFSTENWKRPKKEVDSIMKLLGQYLEECEREINKNDIRFIFLGDNSVLDSKLREKIAFIEVKSKNNTHFVNIALNTEAVTRLSAHSTDLPTRRKKISAKKTFPTRSTHGNLPSLICLCGPEENCVFRTFSCGSPHMPSFISRKSSGRISPREMSTRHWKITKKENAASAVFKPERIYAAQNPYVSYCGRYFSADFVFVGNICFYCRHCTYQYFVHI